MFRNRIALRWHKNKCSRFCGIFLHMIIIFGSPNIASIEDILGGVLFGYLNASLIFNMFCYFAVLCTSEKEVGYI